MRKGKYHFAKYIGLRKDVITSRTYLIKIILNLVLDLESNYMISPKEIMRDKVNCEGMYSVEVYGK